MFTRVDLHVGGLLTWLSGLVDGDVLEGSRRDISVSSPSADESLVLVVDVDCFDGSSAPVRSGPLRPTPIRREELSAGLLFRREIAFEGM